MFDQNQPTSTKNQYNSHHQNRVPKNSFYPPQQQSSYYPQDQVEESENLNGGALFKMPQEELHYIKYLMSEKYKVFETPDVMQNRTKSIQYLQELVENWYI